MSWSHIIMQKMSRMTTKGAWEQTREMMETTVFILECGSEYHAHPIPPPPLSGRVTRKELAASLRQFYSSTFEFILKTFLSHVRD